jgi:hypothetical protein
MSKNNYHCHSYTADHAVNSFMMCPSCKNEIFVAFSIMPASAPGTEDKQVDVEKNKEVHYEHEKDDWCLSPPNKKQRSEDKDTIVTHSVDCQISTCTNMKESETQDSQGIQEQEGGNSDDCEKEEDDDGYDGSSIDLLKSGKYD